MSDPRGVVLVTGAGGFIGSVLCRVLRERWAGSRVVAADRDLRRLADLPAVVPWSVDLCDPSFAASYPAGVDRPDIVIHLAASVGVETARGRPYEVLSNNIRSTLNLIDWATQLALRRFVFSSTSEMYAEAVQEGIAPVPTPESAPYVQLRADDARRSYALSKWTAECALAYLRETLPSTIVRFHNVYGPDMGNRHVIPQVIARLRQRERPLKVFNAEHTRSFCFVSDAVDAVMALLETPAALGAVVHIGNDHEEVSIANLYDRLCRLAGSDAECIPVSEANGSISRRCPDISRLRVLTGFEPQVSLDEGLARTFGWYWEREGADDRPVARNPVAVGDGRS